MSIRIKFREKNKRDLTANVKFANGPEMEFFKRMMVTVRDDKVAPHPMFVVRDINGDHVPRLKQPPMPPPKLTPEQMEKLKIQPVKLGEPVKKEGTPPPQKLPPELIEKMKMQPVKGTVQPIKLNQKSSDKNNNKK